MAQRKHHHSYKDGFSIMTKKVTAILCIATLSCLPGCVPLFFGAATTTTTAAGEERGLGGALSDTSIRARINMKWAGKKPDLLPLVEITVREGRVLLSGTVDKPEQQIEAIRLCWEVNGVKEVIDKMEVGEGTGVFGYLGDSWLTTKMRTAMLADRDIHSTNYTIKTVRGVMYVMGIALSTQELEKVLTRARELAGVEKVISYVRIKEKLISDNADYSKAEDLPASEGKPTAAPPEPVSVESLESPNTQSSFQ